MKNKNVEKAQSKMALLKKTISAPLVLSRTFGKQKPKHLN